MANPQEPLDHTALIRLGDELARAHGTNDLIYALLGRLHADGREGLANLIRMSAYNEDKGLAVSHQLLAPALIARLRIEGRHGLADRIATLLSGASIACDPSFPLNEDDGSLAARAEWAAKLRADGRPEDAIRLETGRLINLTSALQDRLRLDGHGDLAEALTKASSAFEQRAHGPQEAPDRQAPQEAAPPDPREDLGRAHPAAVLAYALLARLRAEGREAFAGALMGYWLHDIAGPIVAPRALASTLLARLRAEDRAEIADAIEPLLGDAAIDRDPEDILAIWQNEIAGPLVQAGPLAAALVAALRAETREARPLQDRRREIADAIEALRRKDHP